MQITVKKETRHGSEQIVFTIPLPGQNPVFMSCHVSDYKSNDHGIVLVDALEFLKLWRNSCSKPESTPPKNESGMFYNQTDDVAHGTPDTWPLDYKYEHAVDGFSAGKKCPVPLAEVSCLVEKSKKSVAFTNGITRTIYLLSNYCVAFPVLCGSSASQLRNLAGIKNTEFYDSLDIIVSH